MKGLNKKSNRHLLLNTRIFDFLSFDQAIVRFAGLTGSGTSYAFPFAPFLLIFVDAVNARLLLVLPSVFSPIS